MIMQEKKRGITLSLLEKKASVIIKGMGFGDKI